MSGLPTGEYCLFFDMKTGRGAYTGNIKFEPTYRGGTSCDDAELVSVTAGHATTGVDTKLTYQEPGEAAVAVADFASDAEEGSLAVDGALVQGEPIVVEVGTDRVGEWVSAFAHSTPTALGSWYRIGVDGTVTVPVPADAPTGAHSLVVQDADGAVLGWDAVTIAAPDPSSPKRFSSTPAPLVTGAAQVGGTLAVSTPAWTPEATTVGYEWFIAGTDTALGTGDHLLVPSSAVGATILVRATGSRDGYASTSVDSAPTAEVVEARPVPGVIVRDTPITIPTKAGRGVTGPDTLELTSRGGARAMIQPGTTITSSDAGWDGTLLPPTVVTDGQALMPATVDGSTPVVALAIQVGDPGSSLTLDQPARILLPGQAGKHAGFVPAGGTFTPITTPCVADTLKAATALPVAGDCVMSVGSDLVIWTKHFTVFLAYGAKALPVTGADLMPWGIGGIALLLLGAALVVTTRAARRTAG